MGLHKKDQATERLKSIPLADVFDRLGIEKQGAGYLCPFHGERTGSLHVNPKTNLFKCFGCDAAGDIFNFYTQLQQIDFATAKKELTEIFLNGNAPAPVKITPQDSSKGQTDYKPRPDVYREFLRYISQNKGGQTYKDAIAYLESRGIDEAIRKKYGIQVISNYFEINNHMKKTFALDELKQSGLCNDKGNIRFYKHPIILPYYQDGNPVYLQARAIGNAASHKYYFLAGVRKPLYNFDAISTTEKIYITEGVFDAIVMSESGYTAVAAGSVTSFSDVWINHLKRKQVVIAFDNDKAGEDGGKKLAQKLYDAGLNVSIAKFRGGKDANELYAKQDKERTNKEDDTRDVSALFDKLYEFVVSEKMRPARWYTIPPKHRDLYCGFINELNSMQAAKPYSLELSNDNTQLRKILTEYPTDWLSHLKQNKNRYGTE